MNHQRIVPSTRSDSPSSEILIEKLVPGGNGLGRIGPQVIFVKGGLPGETLQIQVGAKQRGVHSGDITKILESSHDRVEPPCSIYGVCGGCQLQHLQYEGQLREKRAMLTDALQRIGKIEIPEVGMVMPSPQPLGYRHTIRFVVFKGAQHLQLGFYQAETRIPVEAKTCLLIPKRLQHIAAMVAQRLAASSSIPMFLEQLELRASSTMKDVVMVFHGTYKKDERLKVFLESFLKLPDVVGCVVERSGPKVARAQSSVMAVGQDYITERFGDLTLQIGVHSFMQTNWPVFEAIGNILKEWMGHQDGLRVLELYAGTGALGMSMARNGAFVTFVEPNASALADARRSIALSRVARCKCKRQTGEKFLPSVQSGEYDVIVVDPPRTGLSLSVIQELGRIQASRVFYMSCDVATLARDLARLATFGYRVLRIQPFDMFPQTAHIETLVELAFSEMST
ncbi:MAG: 23S rRNA (uracil-5-)-methyltransferase RumA [Nitrospirales bacterium]|nr:MAG: 23S rRNA (uracil-5-)-methyltransferase RumA [Nitrospirales bacterium]